VLQPVAGPARLADLQASDQIERYDRDTMLRDGQKRDGASSSAFPGGLPRSSSSVVECLSV
jgi:hypothetical protein